MAGLCESECNLSVLAEILINPLCAPLSIIPLSPFIILFKFTIIFSSRCEIASAHGWRQLQQCSMYQICKTRPWGCFCHLKSYLIHFFNINPDILINWGMIKDFLRSQTVINCRNGGKKCGWWGCRNIGEISAEKTEWDWSRKEEEEGGECTSGERWVDKKKECWEGGVEERRTEAINRDVLYFCPCRLSSAALSGRPGSWL